MASSFTVLDGIREDVELILYKFVNGKHYSFSVFGELWKDLQFYHIYSGRPTVSEMKYFTRELLLQVKSHALSNYTTWERSGAIFLMYALYFTQPLSEKVPIRIEQNEWNQLTKFAEDMKNVNIEVSFCFYRLVANYAFDFTFSSKPYNAETMKEDEAPQIETSTKPEKKYKYDKFAMGALLTSIGFDPDTSGERESKYNDIKQSLNEKFPDLCNFDIRRFGVNLLVPPASRTEASVSQQSQAASEKRRVIKKKGKSVNIPLLPNDEVIIDSTLSMPLIQNDGSDLDEN